MVGHVTDIARAAARTLLEPFAWHVQRVRQEVNSQPLFALGLLVVLLFCAVRAVLGDRLAALLLVPLSFAWLLFNSPVEGPTLLVLSWSHGITAADLLSVAGLLIAAGRLAPVLVGR